MSRAEHEALAEAVAISIHAARFDVSVRYSFAEADSSDRAYSMKLARAALALIAQKLETVTPEMGSHGVWLTTLRASPLFPRKDP